MNDTVTTTSGTVTPSPGNKRWWIALALVVPLGAAGFFGWKAWKPSPVTDFAKQSELNLDLQHPDALIESQSLSALPKELLEIPLLRDVLTEDFVFYYEHNPDRLGLLGSLRRIAYEHELQLQDDLINTLLDEPATVALWRGGKGKLDHAAILIKRNGLSTLLSNLAKVALSDNQLGVAAVLQVDGETLSVYRLRYAPGKTLLFASANDQLLVLTHPGLLLEGSYDSAKQAQDATNHLESLLDGDMQWADAFGLESAQSRQRITISADYLAMGYRAFFPALAGFSLEKDAKGWHSQLAYDPVERPQTVNYQPVWRSMPMGASACVALPVASDVPAKLIKKLGATGDQQKLLTEQLLGPVGLCWYPDSRLYTPLVVTRVVGGEADLLDTTISNVFEKTIGSVEPNYPEKRFPVQVTPHDNGKRWLRPVGSNFGQYQAQQMADPTQLASSGFFNVSLARAGDVLMFSLDDTLVTQALATLDKRYPPLLDTLPLDQSVPVYVSTEKLAPLLRREALESLPPSLEPVFRNAAETHLLPKLDALARYGKVAVTVPADTIPDERWQWLPVTWKTL